MNCHVNLVTYKHYGITLKKSIISVNYTMQYSKWPIHINDNLHVNKKKDTSHEVLNHEKSTNSFF